MPRARGSGLARVQRQHAPLPTRQPLGAQGLDGMPGPIVAKAQVNAAPAEADIECLGPQNAPMALAVALNSAAATGRAECTGARGAPQRYAAGAMQDEDMADLSMLTTPKELKGREAPRRATLAMVASGPDWLRAASRSSRSKSPHTGRSALPAPGTPTVWSVQRPRRLRLLHAVDAVNEMASEPLLADGYEIAEHTEDDAAVDPGPVDAGRRPKRKVGTLQCGRRKSEAAGDAPASARKRRRLQAMAARRQDRAMADSLEGSEHVGRACEQAQVRPPALALKSEGGRVGCRKPGPQGAPTSPVG